MRIGIDTYSFHRLLGQLRPGESATAASLADGCVAPLLLARRLGCDVVALETCFLRAPGELDHPAVLDAAGPLELILSWGHPEGLAFGTRPVALAELHEWLGVAGMLRIRLVRLVVGGPALRGVESLEVQLERTVGPVREAAEHAAELGIALAIENHGDLTSAALVDLIGRVDRPDVGACFDTANAARLGEDVVAAASATAPAVRMIHLKDVERLDREVDRVAGPVSVGLGDGVIPLVPVLEALAGPVAAGAPVCVELGQVSDGTDEVALVGECVRWLHAYRSARRAPSAHPPRSR